MTTYLKKKQTMLDKKRMVREWLVGTTFRGILLLIIGVSGVSYIVQTSTMSTKGYDISALKKEVNVLEQENRRLSVQIAEHRSLRSVQSRVAKLDLVVAEDVTFISNGGSAVARR